MSNSCLVTKLKAPVDNTELLKIGEMKIHCNQSLSEETMLIQVLGKSYDAFTMAGGNHIKAQGAGAFTNLIQVSPVSGLASAFIVRDQTDFNLAITEKYDLYYLSCNNCSVDFDIEQLKWSSILSTLSISYSLVYGNIKSLENLSRLRVISLMHSKVYGDIVDLRKLINLSELYINSDINGSVESFSMGLLGNGKTTGNVLIGGILPNSITFNSKSLTPDIETSIRIDFEANSITVKDSASNILGTFNGSQWIYTD